MKKNLQAVPTLNGTSFDFVTTENGPVSLDLYSTPQYKRDQHSDCAGELFAFFLPNWSSWITQTYRDVTWREEDTEDGVISPRSITANHWPWPTFLCLTREKGWVRVWGVSASRRVGVRRRGGVWGWREQLVQRRRYNGENLSLHHETELHLCSHRHDGEYCSPQMASPRSVSSF